MSYTPSAGSSAPADRQQELLADQASDGPPGSQARLVVELEMNPAEDAALARLVGGLREAGEGPAVAGHVVRADRESRVGAEHRRQDHARGTAEGAVARVVAGEVGRLPERRPSRIRRGRGVDLARTRVVD